MTVFKIRLQLVFEQRWWWLWGFAFGLAVSTIAAVVVFNLHYRNLFFQNISIDNVPVGGLTKDEVYQKLQSNYQPPKLDGELVITATNLEEKEKTETMPYRQIINGKDYQTAIDQAFSIGRSGHMLHRIYIIAGLIQQPQNIKADYTFNQTLIQNLTTSLAQQVDYSGEPFSIILHTSGSPNSLEVKQGQDGLELLAADTISEINQSLNQHINQQPDNTEDIPLKLHLPAKTTPINHTLSPEAIEFSQQRALNLVGKNLKAYGYDQDLNIKTEDYENLNQTFANPKDADQNQPNMPDNWLVKKELNDQQLISLLAWPQGIDMTAVSEQVEDWAQDINQPATNAEFEYDQETMKATHFVPDEPGLELKQQPLQDKIVTALNNWDKNLLEKLEIDINQITNNESSPDTDPDTENEVKNIDTASLFTEFDRLNVNDNQESEPEHDTEQINNTEQTNNEQPAVNTNQPAPNTDQPAPNTEESPIYSDNIVILLSLAQTEPEITLADTNDLGIEKVIGFGDSFYYGSIATRLHNIQISSDKLSKNIIAPDEQFSFNQVVGTINHETGYRQAYVIRSGQTLMEFGGGVCQVSTTMFRTMLDAGVNITRRLPHSYRVSYYEYDNKPGFDATVYQGNVDLRFINDTPGHILIMAQADPEQAYMSITLYGTDDGRRAKIDNYQQWGHTPPPPSQEIPDESLAPGERRRVENAIAGLKTSFDWIVTDADDEVLHKKTFYSNFQAWGEKWLVGI